MTLITLSGKEYQRLLEGVHIALHPGGLQRAQALLWLSAGEDATEVAERLFVAPRSVDCWANRLHQRPSLTRSVRHSYGPRSGPPAPCR